MMRFLLATLLLMGGLLSAQAQDPKVYGIDVVWAGTFKMGESKQIDNPDISTGHRYEAPITRLVRTTVIPAKLNTAFGAAIMIRGAPRGKIVPFRIVWRYPQPGLLNPQTGKAKLVDDYVDQRALGQETAFYWSLGDAEWVLVPGQWTLEIWYEGRMLVTQSFTMVKE